jgi:hypothetical protein
MGKDSRPAPLSQGIFKRKKNRRIRFQLIWTIKIK